jgi:hypothetical protein
MVKNETVANQALELTASRRKNNFFMISFPFSAAPRSPARRSSSCSR